MLKLFFIMLLGLLFACGDDKFAQVQVGGRDVIAGDDPINRYTVMVKLAIEEKDGFIHGSCSGTLLSPEHVLLAAHCVENAWGAKVLVGYERKVTTTDGQQFSAVGEGKSFAISKTYLSKFNGRTWWLLLNKLTFTRPMSTFKDIAIIRLAEPLELPYKIEFAIPAPERDLSGEMVTIAGYGVGDIGQKPLRGRKAKIKLVHDYEKSDLLEFTNYFRRLNFGDSGGPVWWHDEEGNLNLIGVHSFMIPLAKFYTWSIDIRHHRQWIDDALDILHQRNPSITAEMDMSKRHFPAFLEKTYQGD